MDVSLNLKNLVGIAVYYFSKLIPRRRKIILFGANNGSKMGDNPKYIYGKLKDDPSIRCVWIFKNTEEVKRVNENGCEAYYFKSVKGLFYQATSKYLVHSHSINDDFYRVLLGGAVSFNTWHGVGVKKIWAANPASDIYKALHETGFFKKRIMKLYVKTNQANRTYHFCTSKTMQSHFSDTFLLTKENLPILGQARNDVFYNSALEDKTIPGWYKENKVILYMPTHREHGVKDKALTEIIDFEKINNICKQNGYIFVLKTHMFSNETGRAHDRESLGSKYEYVKDISFSGYDSGTLLKYADVLVTDYSSAYSDFLLLGRHVVFYCYDLKEFQNSSNSFYFKYEDMVPGPMAHDFTCLCEALRNIEEDSRRYAEERSRVLDIYYDKSVRGEVAQKQADFILANM